ncbi:hypothetical protein [Aeromonas sp. FDAARGOS 1402]|uniref:hypothetical protein n=1 Tax=Aeromonas sp. FDAARGOS 1402 TaxID=2778051 RepID=UPI001C245A86|nr:hypothetical protein [Aeromonas sp. FDAARGOS 1402]QWZ56737.1 hypothetical protein I6L32_23000 [Aeromonas sp. FDAARGOS 1402]
MEEQKKLTYRMQNRELEIREELSRNFSWSSRYSPYADGHPEYDMPYDEELEERTIEDLTTELRAKKKPRLWAWFFFFNFGP